MLVGVMGRMEFMELRFSPSQEERVNWVPLFSSKLVGVMMKLVSSSVKGQAPRQWAGGVVVAASLKM